MARKAREKSSTGMYNIIIKGTAPLFKNDEDYDFFMESMVEYLEEVYAFALTPDVICMAVKESEKGIGLDLKPLMTKYARYYNKLNNLEGKLFADRFKSEPIESDNALKNSVSLIEDLLVLTKADGYTSVNGGGKYEMIDFYAPLAGKKSAVKKAPTAKKTATPKKATAKKETVKKDATKKAAAKKEAPKKALKPEVQKPKVEKVKEETVEKPIEKKKNNSLPTWLL